jgi:glycosyltransferase involved in cell wall biosynthesis
LQSLNCPNLDVLVLDPFEGLNKVSFKQARRMMTQKLEIANCETLISLSPFEKHDSTITIPRSTKYKQVGILYDLIRLQYPKQFLFSKKQKSSRNHWIHLIGTQQNISVIYGGCDHRNIRDKINFQDRHGVMCVGAEQTHKNIERLIRAYSQLPFSLQRDHPLTIVGIRSKGMQKKLLKLGKNGVGKVNLPDYLNPVELELIYENSRLLVMPSIIEGLSMPILEAWSHDLPVIGSIGTVAEEIIQDKQLLFNPYETQEITNKMQNFLVSKSDWDFARKHSIEKASVFTWSRTAKAAISAMEIVSDG